MFKGLYVALVTPFKEDGSLNEEKLRELVHFHIENGTDGLVPCGTTGENPTYTIEEHQKIIRIVCEEAKGKIQGIAGTGSNATWRVIDMTKKAIEYGIDGALVITPYYNKPTQEGLYQHFKKIAEECPIPIMVYNVPGRTSINILPETLARLSKIENIVAVKEASGNVNQMSEIIRLCGDSLTLIVGDDALTLPVLAIGGKGVVSVIGNFLPKDMKSLINAYNNKDREKTLELHYKLHKLCGMMFIETNPSPVKKAMNLLGFDVGNVRLPLVDMQANNIIKLEMVMREYGLLGDKQIELI